MIGFSFSYEGKSEGIAASGRKVLIKTGSGRCYLAVGFAVHGKKEESKNSSGAIICITVVCIIQDLSFKKFMVYSYLILRTWVKMHQNFTFFKKGKQLEPSQPHPGQIE